MKYCEECGEQLEDSDEFCTECGAEQEEIDEYCEEYSIEGDDWSEQERDKPARKIVKPVLFIFLIAVLVLAGILGYRYFTNSDTDNSDDATQSAAPPEPVEDEEIEEEDSEEEFVSETKAPVVDVNDYLGYWYMNGTSENELTILDSSNDQIEFSLFYYRLTSMDNVVAVLDGNVASFSYLDAGTDRVRGKLIFNKGAITVKITESESDYISVDTMVFNSQEYQVPASEEHESGDMDGYIIYDSDSRYISESDLYGLSADELVLARNEIYARKGRGFQDTSIQAYFNSQSWYTKIYSPEEFDAMGNTMLNNYEYQNILTIRNYETEQGY